MGGTAADITSGLERLRKIAARRAAVDVAEHGPVPETPYFDFDPPLEQPGDPLEEAALKFHRENPHVIREIVDVCLRVKRAGRCRWAIKAAYEVVRYNATVTTNGRTYKLNNNHTAFYARWIMRDVPELANFFLTRGDGRLAQDYDE